jgi:hypothetical protein
MRKVVVLALTAALAGLSVAAAALAGNGPRPEADVQVERYPTVRILGVHPNANSGCIGLGLRIRGFTILPNSVGISTNVRNAGHYHIYVNGKYREVGTTTHPHVCGLATGRTYRLQVILAMNDHTEIAARSQVVTAVLG